MTTAPKSSSSAIQPYTDGTCLILKRVRFANGKLYDIRIRKNGEDGSAIGFGKIAASTLSEVEDAVVTMFKDIIDPTPVSIKYTHSPEACVLTNKVNKNPDIDLMDPYIGAPSVVKQARKVYQCLRPQTRTAISLNPKAQLVRDPIHISATEADQWNAPADKKRFPTPSAPKLKDLPSAPETAQTTSPDPDASPLPESDDESVEAPVPAKPALSNQHFNRLLFQCLDAVPLKYKKEVIKYTELRNYYSIPEGARKNHKLSPFIEALQKVIGSPGAEDEKEIRKWMIDLYQAAYRFYSEHTQDSEEECRKNAARVVLTYSSKVPINDYVEKLLKIELPLFVRFGSTDVSVECGDITEMSGVEAIVNAANRQCLSGDGVDGAIHKAAGSKLLEECRKLPDDEEGNRCDTGCAVSTGSGRLSERGINYVIHAVGPDCREITDPDEAEELLRDTYRNALEEAHSRGVRSIAFPAISTGIYKYPFDKALQVALETIEEYSTENPSHFDRIKLVFLKKDFDAAARRFKSLISK